MLRKIAALAAVVTVLPLGTGVVSSISSPIVANAATKKATKKTTKKTVSKTYVLQGSKKIKKTAFHIKSGSPALYKGGFSADQPKVSLTKIGTLKTRKTYNATKQITIKQNKKNVKYVYVTNGKTKGWTLFNKLTAGKFMPAD